jgi:hypothetical protein
MERGNWSRNQNYSRYHINAIIQDSNLGIWWKFFGFYGHPEANKHKDSWSLLRRFAEFSPNPWLCIGDFNVILSSKEKISFYKCPYLNNLDFQNALDDCWLIDLGFKGPRYTCSNCRNGRELTKERLNRAVANAEWCSLYNVKEVNVLTRIASDCHPILLSCHNKSEVGEEEILQI